MTSPLFVSSESQPEALLHFFSAEAPCRSNFAGPLFVLATAGEATVEIDARPHLLPTGTLLTLLPYHLLRAVAVAPDFRCLTLAFTFDSMTDFPYLLPTCISEQMERTHLVQLTAQEHARLADLHRAIALHHTLTAHPSYREIQRSQLFIFTAEVSAIYSTQPITPLGTYNEELTSGFFHLLHEHFRTHRDVAFYADHLCLSTKHLARVITQVTTHAPSYWIADFTVREAKALLKSTTLTVTQLSESLNFPNSSFFARYFKRHTGVSPQQFRFPVLPARGGFRSDGEEDRFSSFE